MESFFQFTSDSWQIGVDLQLYFLNLVMLCYCSKKNQLVLVQMQLLCPSPFSASCSVDIQTVDLSFRRKKCYSWIRRQCWGSGPSLDSWRPLGGRPLEDVLTGSLWGPTEELSGAALKGPSEGCQLDRSSHQREPPQCSPKGSSVGIPQDGSGISNGQ